MTYIGEEFQKRFKALPEDVQEALTAVASVDTIFVIGKKHGLMVDQIGKMADEIWKVMLGLANPKDFIRNLASVLSIDSLKASAIASDVNAQMFQPVRESLRKIYDEESGIKNKELGGQKRESEMSSLRPREAGDLTPRNDNGGKIERRVPAMIYPHTKEFGAGVYPQDRFEESFKKENGKIEEENKEVLEQLAPLVPAITPLSPLVDNPLNPPYPKGGDNKIPPLKVRGGEGELLYPEKTKEVSRESTKSRDYQGKDPYRELIEN